MQTSKTITLETPIKRGETSIESVEVRKPVSGELRGCNLTDLLQMDVVALTKLLPRITTPSLTEQEIGRMDPADMLQMGTEVSSFLLPNRMKQADFLPE